jgi:hypothetical protein
MRLRQFVFVAEKLEPAVEEITGVLGLEVCYQDPGVAEFGLENALFAIGGNFLEIVAPTEEGTAAGRFLERRGGNGGYMVILQCGDATAERERISALKVRDVWRHDGPEAFATHFHPADVGGAILSIDSMASSADLHDEMTSWKWAGPNWQDHVQTTRTSAMVGLEFQTTDPAELAQTWSEVVGSAVSGGTTIGLDNATLHFSNIEDGRGPGVGGLMLHSQNRPAIMAEADRRGLKTSDNAFMLCGVRTTLV